MRQKGTTFPSFLPNEKREGADGLFNDRFKAPRTNLSMNSKNIQHRTPNTNDLSNAGVTASASEPEWFLKSCQNANELEKIKANKA